MVVNSKIGLVKYVFRISFCLRYELPFAVGLVTETAYARHIEKMDWTIDF
jgi:hypothetical protein